MKNETDRSLRGRIDAAPAVSSLDVVIPHRTPQLTRIALPHAQDLAAGLHLRIRLIDVHVVPYGFPLHKPTVSPKYLARRLRRLALEVTAPVSAEIVYALDREQGLRRSLARGSLVLMTIKRSWWPTGEKRLAARLRKTGHQVIWVDSE